jgi:phosphate transport system substrate-binding protein
MVVFTTAFRRTVVASVATASLTFGPLFTAIAQAITLNGAGATFPAPLYERYAAEIKKKYPDMQINYQAIGSGGGVRQVIAGTVDFGGSDAAMTDEQMAEVKNGVLLVPTAGGAVAVVYNLPGVNNLKLSRKVLPAIFSGQITRWNDPKIAAENPGAKLPNLPIRSVVRADGSGTTFIFTNHLSAIDPYFKGRIGVGTAPKWTTNPIKGKGNPGVAAQVSRTLGGIGYVEYAFAKQNRLQTAQVQNKQGDFVSPSLETANKALATVKYPENFRVFEGDPTAGYPITGLTWLMVYKKYSDPAKAEAVKKMVDWILTEGQNLNDDLDYTRIPNSVAERARTVVRSNVK